MRLTQAEIDTLRDRLNHHDPATPIQVDPYDLAALLDMACPSQQELEDQRQEIKDGCSLLRRTRA